MSLHGSKERVGNPRIAMAVTMSGEQLTEILSNMQNSMMDALQKVINNNTATASVAASAAATAQEQYNLNTKPERKEFTPKFDPKSFARLDKFSGGDAAWKDWSFDLKVIATAINPSLTQWFTIWEKPEAPTATAEDWKREYGKADVDPKDIEAKSKELFGLLCILTEGEAKTMVRGQSDGFAAWALLHSTYSRTTLARTVRILKETLVPKKATTVAEVILKITEWELKVAGLGSRKWKKTISSNR